MSKFNLPVKRPLNEVDMQRFGSKLPHFRGVYCRGNLNRKPWKKELLVFNLDSCKNMGTHWVGLASSDGVNYYYYDSYGNLPPPPEIIHYLKGKRIFFNFKRDQSFKEFNCGNRVLTFLQKFSRKYFH